MSKKRDYYEVLGISKNATEKDIKRAYRKLAMKYHPDTYDGSKAEAETKFKEINEAYSVLSDSQQKSTYDRFGHAGLSGQGRMDFDPMDIFSSFFGGSRGGSGGSVFDSIFGGGGGFSSRGGQRRRGPSKGEDVILQLSLTLEEAYEGISKKVRMPFNKACDNCRGSGGEPNTGMKTCRTCGGHGIVEKHQSSGFFTQITQVPCSNCRGQGKVPEKKCKACGGKGLSSIREEITVRIPKGIDDGEAVRVQGKGRPSMNGGLPGDLIFRIRLKEHKKFVRDGNDVYTKIEVDYPTLAVGGEIEVDVVGGKGDNHKTKLKIPAGTQHNEVLTIRNKGINRKVRGQNVRGHMRYVVQLNVPKKLKKKEKELLLELRDIKKR